MSLKNVEVALADHADLLDFEVSSNGVIIKPKGYIRDRAKFDEITEIVRSDLNGKYVAQKDGGPYWFVPFEESQSKAEEKGNNGTYGTLHCPYCGKTIDVTFKPRKEA